MVQRTTQKYTTRGYACLCVCVYGGPPEHNTSFLVVLFKWAVLLIRTDLLAASGININQGDAGYCLCTKYSRLLPLKISCSLILSLSRPDHV